MNLTDEFKNLIFKRLPPDEALLVPILRWTSAYESNIDNLQKVNRWFVKIDKSVLCRNLALNNNLHKFISYPKESKRDEKLEFFYDDVAKYLGWTRRELDINFDTLDWKELKQEIPTMFAYDKKETKLVGKI